eukprot:SAG31_NODE_8680_length_1407_cov_1.523700_2_plen_219_part_01
MVISQLGGLQLTPDRGGLWAESLTITVPLEQIECWELLAQRQLVAVRVVDNMSVGPRVLTFRVADDDPADAAAVLALLDGLSMCFRVQVTSAYRLILRRASVLQSQHMLNTSICPFQCPAVVPPIFGEMPRPLLANTLLHHKVAAGTNAVQTVTAGGLAPGAEMQHPDSQDLSTSSASTEGESAQDFQVRLATTFSLMDKHGTGHVSYVQFLQWWKARV